MLEVQTSTTNHHLPHLETIIYSAFNQHFADWIKALGAVGGTANTYGKIFMCNSSDDSSDSCEIVSRNSTYIGFGVAFPIILIGGIPLLLNQSRAKKVLEKINSGIGTTMAVLANQTFYLLVVSWGAALIFQTSNINDFLFLGAIAIPTCIAGILTPTEIRSKIYEYLRCCNRTDAPAGHRNFCQKFMDGVMGILEGSAVMVLSIKSIEQIIDYIHPTDHPLVDTLAGEIFRGAGGGLWGLTMGVKNYRTSPYRPDLSSVDTTKDFRDIIHAFFTAFAMYTLMVFTILDENMTDQISQFTLLGLLTLLSLGFAVKNIVNKRTTEQPIETLDTVNANTTSPGIWGTCSNYFKSLCPTRTIQPAITVLPNEQDALLTPKV